ncbi:jg17662 [Pararge aegeria aegeria]|uniref:Jg17662 protein n=1 Tax=Pararge aegeria aegeria TaxID=348720 RepID=A0A8S4RGI5_9NEOP|nr:jg17662 [Pararge aegeria aegeria]
MEEAQLRSSSVNIVEYSSEASSKLIMHSKIFVIFATLFAVLLLQQTACEEVQQVDRPDELYIMNPGSAFPFIVTDPNSPILSLDRKQIIRICIASQCQSVCRSWGYRVGRCNAQAICVCSR